MSIQETTGEPPKGVVDFTNQVTFLDAGVTFLYAEVTFLYAKVTF